MIARRSARSERPLAPSEANPDGRPTRPDKLSIWPTEDERFGIDVLYVGAQGPLEDRLRCRFHAPAVDKTEAAGEHPQAVDEDVLRNGQ